MFADLIEAALKAGYRLPTLPRPTPGPPLHARAAAQHVPDSILQHPGYYYYLAALCAVRRRDCYKSAEAALRENGSPNADVRPSTALAHERAVPHSEQIVELFSKAYEYFKREKATRVTLYLADQISAVHSDTGNSEIAQKFDDRTSRTYRREGWTTVLDGILSRSTNPAAAQEEDNQASLTDKNSAAVTWLCKRYLERMALVGKNVPCKVLLGTSSGQWLIPSPYSAQGTATIVVDRSATTFRGGLCDCIHTTVLKPCPSAVCDTCHNADSIGIKLIGPSGVLPMYLLATFSGSRAQHPLSDPATISSTPGGIGLSRCRCTRHRHPVV